jgi:4-amino-4-deoxy-L-arabinose transferase-like glycosyltransferase
VAFASLLWTFARRLAYPYDLEWMEGAMLLHALRLREGQPLYAPPSLAFVSFAYPPLQPVIVAAASLVFGLDYSPARAASILGYLLATCSAYAFLREAGTPRRFALGGLALSAAAFAPTGAWYDLVRIDSVWLGLLAAGLWLAWRARVSARAAVAAGVLLAAALFTKQTAAPFIVVAAVLLLAANRRRAVLLGATVATIVALGVVLLQRATDGWFWRYAFGLHQRHDFDPWLGYVLAPLRVALLLGPAVALIPLAWGGARRAGPARAFAGVDGAFLAALGTFAAAMVATIRGAGPPWGYANAFIPAVFFGAVLLALAAARVHGRRAAWLAPALLALSVAGAPGGFVWAADRLWPGAGLALPVGYDPRAFVPSADDRRRGDNLIARLRAVRGPVFVPFHPFYARRADKAPTLHAQNLADINAIPDLGTPRDLVEAIRARRFDLIVLDVEAEGEAAEAEAMGQFPRLAGNYSIVERIDGPRVVSGAPVRPRLLLVPRP